MREDFSVRMTLLDQQVVDADRLPVGRVDDLELSFPSDALPELRLILTGSEALGERVGGRLGRWMSSASRRLRNPGSASGPASIETALIADTEPLVKLSVAADDLKGVAGLSAGSRRTSSNDCRGRAMRVSELLGAPVVDSSGRSLGKVRDLRARREGREVRVTGLGVGDARLASAPAHAWGFAQDRAAGPWPLRRLTERAVRRARFLPADQVADWGPDPVVTKGDGATLRSLDEVLGE